MTTKSFDAIATDLERLCLELPAIGPRIGYAEVVITDAEQPFTVRWVAVNEEQIWRTSENYVRLSDAVWAIVLLPGGREWLRSYVPRLVDERSPETEAREFPATPSGSES